MNPRIGMGGDELLAWLHEDEPDQLRRLFGAADEVRRQHVGDEVFFRGLVEVSNHCVRGCAYCGLRAANDTLRRYRMTADEVLAAAREAKELGFGTTVLQAGEDPELTAEWVADVVLRIKRELGLAVTLSLGERDQEDFALWREAGADRYLLRFETSDRELYDRIHPPHGRRSDRPELLRILRRLGYEAGGGIMVGIPGQTYESVRDDLLLMRSLDLDMIGVGPFLPHPQTPMAGGRSLRLIAGERQVPNTARMTCKVVALARLACPTANLPATSALATLDPAHGRERALSCGANIVMPDLTPAPYRAAYEIYPGKACIDENGATCAACLKRRIEKLGRRVGKGPGGRHDRGNICSSGHGSDADGAPPVRLSV
jgi:biotin synthase